MSPFPLFAMNLRWTEKHIPLCLEGQTTTNVLYHTDLTSCVSIWNLFVSVLDFSSRLLDLNLENPLYARMSPAMYGQRATSSRVAP